MAPTTGVLDNFNRANGFLTASADWSQLGGADVARITSNQVDNVGALASYVGDWWDTATFGPDSETTMVINVDGDYFGIHGRLQNPASGTLMDGYKSSWSGSTLSVERIDDSSSTTLGSTVSLAKAAGMTIFLECIGTTIKVHTESGDVWTERISRTDSAYGSAGNIGFDYYDVPGALKLDDFGGGTVVVEEPSEVSIAWITA